MEEEDKQAKQARKETRAKQESTKIVEGDKMASTQVGEKRFVNVPGKTGVIMGTKASELFFRKNLKKSTFTVDSFMYESLLRQLKRSREVSMRRMNDVEKNLVRHPAVVEWLVNVERATSNADTLLAQIEEEAWLRKSGERHSSSSSDTGSMFKQDATSEIMELTKRLQDLAMSSPLLALSNLVGSSSNYSLNYTAEIQVSDDQIAASVEELKKKRNSVMSLMDDAEEKQFSETCVKEWLVDLKHSIYEADTLLDQIETEVHFKELYKEGTLFSYTQKATSKANKIIEKLELLTNVGIQDMGLQPRDEGNAAASAQHIQVSNDRFSTSVLYKSAAVYGREKERDHIMEWVLSSPEDAACSNKVEVIIISGKGGLGKTTLARFVYNHAEVKACFKRSWVSVSDRVELVQVIQDILESLTRQPVDFCDLVTLQEKLKEELRGKRFLVVLDDVWDLSEQSWKKMINPFSTGAQGSKVIVTTRNQLVASVVSSDCKVELPHMSEDDGWTLFSRDVFQDEEIGQHSELEVIGKEIVTRCRGLPLAIETVGALLRSKRDVIEWKRIRESSVWQLPEGQNDIVPALALSYFYLPSLLKTCFAYCSLFPKNYRFSSEELVNLWIDEGFVQKCDDDRLVEDVGKAYFADLLSRSFFTKENDYGETYVMHDSIHDLAQTVYADFHWRMDGQITTTDYQKIRHVSFQDSRASNGSINVQGLHQMKSLQTVMAHTARLHPRWDLDDEVLNDIILQQLGLRVLSLRGTKIRMIPFSIYNLKLLRCLDVSYTDVELLPLSLSRLYNLRRLLCECCDRLSECEIWKSEFISLRHFTMSGKQLRKAPEKISKLTECSVLMQFYLTCSSEHLQPLDVGMGLNTGLQSAAEKPTLQAQVTIDKSRFSYSVVNGADFFFLADQSDLLESLMPHKNLEEIEIQFFNGKRFPTWLDFGWYGRVKKVKLVNCQLSSGMMPVLGGLRSLKYLRLEDVRNIKRLQSEFFCLGFGVLEELFFEDMKDWEVWDLSDDAVGGICFFPRLKKLHLLNCPRLEGRLPAQLPSLKELVLRDCRSLVDLCLVDNSFGKFSSLGSLVLEGCDFPGSFPVKGSLSASLTSLRIKSFTALKRLDVIGLQSLVCLEELVIDDCPMLETLPESLPLSSDEEEGSANDSRMPEALPAEILPLISDVEEDFPDDVDSFPSSLTTLGIENCINLKRLDDGWLQSLASLQELLISGCRKLECLPEEGLRSSLTLKKLCIYNCPMLEALPEEGLPCSLEVLRLCWNHPKLRERCRRDTGPDWPKIAHVPEIRIL